MRIVFLGLSITSSWGNGHATTYRSLLKELNTSGHQLLFLERDVPWYRNHRDLHHSAYCEIGLYESLSELKNGYTEEIRNADMVIVGSYVPEGVLVGEWVTKTAKGIKAFYDIDTPVTVSKLLKKDYEYLAPRLIPQYDLYLSFAGGSILELLQQKFNAAMPRPLYCSFDPQRYYHQPEEVKWEAGYLGTYSDDRQPPLEKIMLNAASRLKEKRFIVAGSGYPEMIQWPSNVEYQDHLEPSMHRSFYNSQRFAINITRLDMVKNGYSPSVRLFEAAACGTPVISDYWEGIEEFFVPGKEILIAHSTDDTLEYLLNIAEDERIRIGKNARQKVMEQHSPLSRVKCLEQYVSELNTVSLNSSGNGK